MNKKIKENNMKNNNITIKNELLNKKRKNKMHENIVNKDTGKKFKKHDKNDKKVNDNNNITNTINKDINRSDNNNMSNKDANDSSMMKELNRLLKEECNKNNELIDICPHWKGTYKNIFSCCNKDYGCDECHALYESHHMVYSEDSLCLFCYQKFRGDYCPYCKTEKSKKRK